MLVPLYRIVRGGVGWVLVGKVSEMVRRPPKRPGSPDLFWASELAQPCPLKVFLDRVKPRPPPLGAALVEEMGRRVHELFGRAAASLGWKTEVEASLSCGEGVRVTGRADIYDPSTSTVIEVKTVPDIPEEPYEEHSLQTLWYMEALRATTALLVYVSRSTGRVEVYNVSETSIGDAHETMCRRAIMLRQHLLERRPPDCRSGPWCRWCPYRDICPCHTSSERLEEYLGGGRR